MYNRFSFLLISGLLFSNFCIAEVKRHEENIIEHLLHSAYCVSPEHQKQTEKTFSTNTNDLFSMIKKMFGKIAGNIQHALKIEEFQGRDLSAEKTFELLARLLSSHTQEKNKIIDPKILHDLDILARENEDIMSILWSLMQLQTIGGKIETYFTLCNPTTDVQELRARQQLIESLSQLDLKKVENIFATIKNTESSLAQLLSVTPLNDSEKKLIFSRILPRQFPALLQTQLVVSTALPAAALPLSLVGLFCGYKKSKDVAVNIQQQIYGIDSKQYQAAVASSGWKNSLKDVYTNVPHTLRSLWQNANNQGKAILAGYSAFITFTQFSAITNSYVLYSFYTKRALAFQGMIMHVREYLDQCAEIIELLRAQNLAAEPEIQPLISLLERTEISSLRRMLDSSTFHGEPSALSNWARIFTTAEKIYELRAPLAEIMHHMGRLESFHGIARLINSSRDQENTIPFCIAEYVIQSKTPIFQIRDSWNPLILTHQQKENVISNNISLGQDTQAQNMILTGPNTCGKTMITTGFTIALLMAQTFGIAPARQFILTPFERILVTLTIKSDGAIGDSRFKAEVREAKRLHKTISDVSDSGGFVFTLLDEIFTGTNPQDGEIAAYEFLKMIGEIPGGIAILATHFFKLTELAKQYPNTFMNYKVVAERHADGTIVRQYKIAPGISTLNIAMDLLRQEGLFS